MVESLPQNPRKTTILLVDSEPESLESLRTSLEDTQIDVVETTSLAEGITEAGKRRPDLILSELRLDDGSGFALCRRIRENEALAEVPIVLVSRWSHEADRILAFECGADDFVAKPFFARELASRIRALLRRRTPGGRGATRDPATNEDRFQLHRDEQEVTIAGRRVSLTPREFALLTAMARRRGHVLSRSELIREAWGDDEAPSARSVDAHVKSLRRKLGQARDTVETVRGLGYRLSELALSSLERKRA